MRVTEAEFIQNFDTLTEEAVREPVTITKNGQDFVLLSAKEFDRLYRRDRRVVRPQDLSAEQVAAIAAAEVPSEYAYLDSELADWKP